ncbi:hypothetical protein [Rhodococcus opacus]|uniref:Lipoprotein n=1 Tax=Rhodococcus opacus (strain B4) TaxID=632772 RepID=C1B9F5_RHOOB|nr:hypothetical protein [Rhodococcus opacus]BAH52308.1 hypothetical protein ROP_40610 [Rhodococcus opacus B4]
MRITHALVSAAVLCAALVGCSNADDTTTPSTPTAEPSPAFPGAPVDNPAEQVADVPTEFDVHCDDLLMMLDNMRKLDPNVNANEVLDYYLTESQSSPAWDTTPALEQKMVIAAFEQAKTGSC